MYVHMYIYIYIYTFSNVIVPSPRRNSARRRRGPAAALRNYHVLSCLHYCLHYVYIIYNPALQLLLHILLYIMSIHYCLHYVYIMSTLLSTICVTVIIVYIIYNPGTVHY